MNPKTTACFVITLLVLTPLSMAWKLMHPRLKLMEKYLLLVISKNVVNNDVTNGRSSDLHAADVVYHRSCGVNFRTGRQIPTQY